MRLSTKMIDLQLFNSIFYIILLLIREHVCHFEEEEVPSVLLISMDGFRHDYIERAKKSGRATPNFDIFIQNGVKTERGMKPAYISSTATNHYSIATGLYAETHGIIHNLFCEPDLKDCYDFENHTDQSESKWYKGTPIWITNELNPDKNYRSGVYQWIGGEAEFNNRKASDSVIYGYANHTIPWEVRVDTVLSWFTDHNSPINLGLLYFPEPDMVGHHFGPNSFELYDKIAELDKNLGYLIESLEKHELSDRINVIITADHGMTEKKPGCDIYLEDILKDPSIYKVTGQNPILHVWPEKGKEEEIYNTLKSYSGHNSQYMNVYRKSEVPEDYHYSHSERIAPIVVEATLGADVIPVHKPQINGSKPYKGGHGYNNSEPDMFPFFIAKGPAFKQGYVSTTTFSNVDIYSLICEILKLEPAVTNGSLHIIGELLLQPKVSHNTFTATSITFILSVLLCACFAAVFTIVACRHHRRHRLRHRRHLNSHELSQSIADEGRHSGLSTRLLTESDFDDEDELLS
ncbi:unnamed protein product [Owenia fusiformis]|uniref:Uncharacterized protein n=1 Tax=Owenia fusiformis TaxID=6347 RepID=A0A8J1TEE4_OWEFU|nr:unnamed protein product [Owenia fusiformis]